MQVTETIADGLKRELKVTVPSGDLKARVDSRLEDLKGKIKLNGFRPGKVPLDRVRQMYGRSVMAEVLEETVGETSAKALEDRKERPAFRPDIKLSEDQSQVERMIEGVSDLEYTMSFEVLPKIELADLKSITIEKDVAQPLDTDIEKSVERLLKANVAYEPKDGEAVAGDRLTVDYRGSTGGEEFEGGSGEDAFVILGSGRFIPGFEEGLIGAKAGENRTVRLRFPDDYQAEQLAGKDAVFEVAVKEAAAPVDAVESDEFAASLGIESMSKLREALRGQLQKELDTASRNKLKTALLDALNERHTFELPPSLIEAEFETLWRNLTARMEEAKETFESGSKTEEEAREDYRRMAERRVRLGLVLSEIGAEHDIKVSEEELRRAMIDRAREFPGHEREIIELYRKNPKAIDSLRAPAYEEKIITFALELVKIGERQVTPEELLAAEAKHRFDRALLEAPAAGNEEYSREVHDHDHGHVHGPDCDHDHD